MRTGRLASVEEVDAAAWDALAGEDGLYVSHAWLRCVEAHGEARYAVASPAGDVAAAIPLYRVQPEPNPWYDPARLAELLGHEGSFLLAGARAGYRTTLLAASREALAAALEEARSLASGEGATALVFPFLTSAALAALASVAPVTAALDTVEAEVADCTGGLAEYEARLDGRRRNMVRRERRALRESGLRVGVRRLDGCWRDLVPLLANVQRKYGSPAEPSALAHLLEQEARHLAERSVVFTCEDGGGIAGATVAYRWSGTLFGRLAGFDYGRLPGAFEYFNLGFYEPLAYLGEAGLRNLHLGVGSWETKAHRGATIRPLWTALVTTGTSGRGRLLHPERVDEWIRQLEAGGHSFDPREWHAASEALA